MTSSPRSVVRFLGPWCVGLLMLTAFPAVASLVLSMTESSNSLKTEASSWVGVEHYRNAVEFNLDYEPKSADPIAWRLLGGKPIDEDLFRSLVNSITYAQLSVPISLISALAVALLLNRSSPGMRFFRGFVYLPHLLGGVATIVIWSWLFNPQFGWINQFIRLVYRVLDPLVQIIDARGTSQWMTPDWLYSPSWCMPALLLMSAWTMGGAMLIFLAALRGIPKTLYDAAHLDGASARRSFFHITWPQLTPAMLFNMLVGTVFAMQAFAEPYLLANRKQDDGLLLFVLQLYRVAFEPPYKLNYACAMAWIFVVILAVMVVPIFWTARRWVFEPARADA